MTLAEMRNELAFILNVDEAQANQDFTTARLNRALNYADNTETEKAKQNGYTLWFKRVQPFTWPISTPQATPPAVIHRTNTAAVYNVTNSDPGYRFIITEGPDLGGDAFWFDNKTLQWQGVNAVGPSTNLSLRFFYLGNAVQMVTDEDESALIPPQFHWLLVWSAACWLKQVADERIPETWQKTLLDWQQDFWKFLSKARPMDSVQTIRQDPTDYENDTGWY